MKITARSLLLTLSFLLTLPALAIDWDWGDELASRQWRSESLDWASESHPAGAPHDDRSATTRAVVHRSDRAHRGGL